jgi:5-hydroxyisourate hydrolase
MSLSTHVLDLVSGQPAPGVRVKLFLDTTEIGNGVTDADGRCRELLGERPLVEGCYRLVFFAGDYFARMHPDSAPGFFDEIPVEFKISNTERHYHVPLLLSPYGYSTYRGS